MEYTTVGIDVSKAKLDVFFSDTQKAITISNNKDGFKAFYKLITKSYPQIERCVIEHTGSYQRELVNFLQAKNIPVSVVSPSKVRNYAKVIGYLAKTDRIDAKLLALFGKQMQPDLTPQINPKIVMLRDLIKNRRQFVDNITLTKQWLEKKPSAITVKRINAVIKTLRKQISEIDAQIKSLIKNEPSFKRKYDTLTKTNGVGYITAITLLAELPELGEIQRKKVAALCGIAPMKHESGSLRNKAFIQGGRLNVRNALYMATVASLRTNKVIKDYYDRLRAKGKPVKVVVVACMHKLIIHLNSLLAQL